MLTWTFEYVRSLVLVFLVHPCIFLWQYNLFCHVLSLLGLHDLFTNLLVTFSVVTMMITILAFNSLFPVSQSGPIFTPFCVYIALVWQRSG